VKLEDMKQAPMFRNFTIMGVDIEALAACSF